MYNTLFWLLGICCLAWVLLSLYIAWSLLRIPRFENLAVSQTAGLPRLSIIVAACNEESHLPTALQTLQQQDYPDLEVIMVNDRSSDATGSIMHAMEGEDKRFRAIDVSVLPEGWLGKVNAQQQAVQQASGDWLLFTDADVHFNKTLLMRAVAWCEQQQLDHLVLMPDVVTRNFWLEVCIRTFALMFLFSTRAVSVNNPDSKAFIGVGAFNLVRKTFLENTEGLQWLRMEVADDAGLGLMVKNNGGRQYFAMSRKDMWIDWYPDIRSMFRGLEKNLFAGGAQYRLYIMLIQVVMILALALGPFIALSKPMGLDTSWLGVTSLAALMLLPLTSIWIGDSAGWKVMFMPVGLVVIALMFLNSGYRCWRQGGIMWRGTLYPLAELRKGQRVKL